MNDIETRERIVEVATEYFFKYGFSKVTTDELATELGMSKKTLYKFFDTKEAILREVIQMMMKEWNVIVGEFLHDETIAVTDRLRRLMLCGANQYSRVSKQFAEDLQRHEPGLWREINDWRNKRILNEFQRFITEGVERNVFRNDVPVPLLVRTYAAVIQSMLNPEMSASLPYTVSQMHETISKILFEGILTDPGRKQYQRSHIAIKTIA